jgi:hypothetical protein
MGAKQLNLVGTRFSRLVVLNKLQSRVYGNNKKRIWECQCDCGNTIKVYTSGLTSGNTKSCGCYKSEISGDNGRNSRHKVAKKNAALRSVFATYISNANNRGIEFKLTVDEFYDIISQNCYYCAIEPSNLYDKHYYAAVYNGIDRKDNTIGYTIENCVPCCKICNIAKNNHTFEGFIEWSIRLAQNLLQIAKKEHEKQLLCTHTKQN